MRFHQCPQSGTDPERGPVGDEDLAIGVVGESLLAPELLRDGPAQRGLAPVVGITRAAIAHRSHRRCDDVRRRRRVGLPAHQGDQRAPLGLELPDLLQDAVDGRRPQP